MIDNRGILVLAVDTVEKVEQAIGETTIDQERVLPIIESALTDAWRQGFAQGLRQQESEQQAKAKAESEASGDNHNNT